MIVAVGRSVRSISVKSIAPVAAGAGSNVEETPVMSACSEKPAVSVRRLQ